MQRAPLPSFWPSSCSIGNSISNQSQVTPWKVGDLTHAGLPRRKPSCTSSPPLMGARSYTWPRQSCSGSEVGRNNSGGCATCHWTGPILLPRPLGRLFRPYVQSSLSPFTSCSPCMRFLDQMPMEREMWDGRLEVGGEATVDLADR